MSDTIPETVAAVLTHDHGATSDCIDSCIFHYAAPALAREVHRLLGLLDALPASWRNLSDERDTARAECERLRAGLVEALEMARHDRRCWQELSSEGTCTCSTGEAVPRLRALAEVPQ